LRDKVLRGATQFFADRGFFIFCQPSQRALENPARFEGAEDAQVVKLVDAPDSKSGSERSAGSIPALGTKL
jgi:hypothetical protein